MSRKWSFINLIKFKSATITKPYYNYKNGFPDYKVTSNQTKYNTDQTQIAILLRVTLNEY